MLILICIWITCCAAELSVWPICAHWDWYNDERVGGSKNTDDNGPTQRSTVDPNMGSRTKTYLLAYTTDNTSYTVFIYMLKNTVMINAQNTHVPLMQRHKAACSWWAKSNCLTKSQGLKIEKPVYRENKKWKEQTGNGHISDQKRVKEHQVWQVKLNWQK